MNQVYELCVCVIGFVKPLYSEVKIYPCANVHTHTGVTLFRHNEPRCKLLYPKRRPKEDEDT
jgi:hypothetical protein